MHRVFVTQGDYRIARLAGATTKTGGDL